MKKEDIHNAVELILQNIQECYPSQLNKLARAIKAEMSRRKGPTKETFSKGDRVTFTDHSGNVHAGIVIEHGDLIHRVMDSGSRAVWSVAPCFLSKEKLK